VSAGVLQLVDVVKRYPGDPPVEALRGVSLTIREGEMLAIMGRSGSGKSTLLHVMGTLDTADEGVVRVAGWDTSTLGDRQLSALRSRHVGFVFQQSSCSTA
jgi:putative ABC transport system ATP-binding protein